MKLREKVFWFATGGAAIYSMWQMLRQQNTILTEIQQQQTDFQEQLIDQSVYTSQQSQSLMWLNKQFDFKAPLPPMRKWVISADVSSLLVQLIREHQPKTILEFGAGVSTLIMAKALEEMGSGHIYALDGLETYAAITRQNVQRQQLETYASVIYAPLVSLPLNEQTWMWYDHTTFDYLSEIDFVFVDGPPQFNNPRRMARYPALPMIYDRIKTGGIIVLDDTNREDERLVGERWMRECPGLVEIETYPQFEKGATVLQKQ